MQESMRKRSRIVPLAVLGVVVLYPSLTSAQICRGTADLSARSRVQVGTLLERAEVRPLTSSGNSTSLDAIVAAGSHAYFAETQIGFTFAEPDVRTIDTDVFGALQFTADAQRRVLICPGFVFRRSADSDYGGTPALTFTTRSVGGGVAVGAAVWDNRIIQIIPAAFLMLERLRLQLRSEAYRDGVSDNVATLELGLGFVMNRRYALKPSFMVPLVDFQGADIGGSFRVTFTASSR